MGSSGRARGCDGEFEVGGFLKFGPHNTDRLTERETESSSRSKATLSNIANSASLPRSKGSQGWTPFQDSHHMRARGRA